MTGNSKRPKTPRAKASEEEALFGQFAAHKKIVIAESTGATRATIAKILRSLNIPTAQIRLAGDQATAITEIRETHPHIVITSYKLGKDSGLELLEYQRRFRRAEESLFIVIATQDEVALLADTADEEIDTYVIKPFSVSDLKGRILKAVEAKVRPDTYRKLITAGKNALLERRMERAAEFFTLAIACSQKPALAYYYFARTLILQHRLDQAEEAFRNGLRHTPTHYFCLSGFFDLLVRRQKFGEAYEQGRAIHRAYPLSPERLEQLLEVAVKAARFEDVEKYYERFTQFDHRSPSLLRKMGTALVAAGKHYLGADGDRTAKRLFDRAAIVEARGPEVMHAIVLAYLESGRAQEAQQRLQQFPPALRGQPLYLVAQLLVLDATAPAAEIVAQGRRILQQGVEEPGAFEIVIKRALQLGQDRVAESVAYDAARKWPAQSDRFLRLVHQNPL